MVSLKMTEKERKAQYEETPALDEGSQYPYGTALHLSELEVDKLGLGDLSASDEITFTAKAFASSVSTHDTGKKKTSVTLQITDMEVDSGAPRSNADRAASIYNSEDN